MRKDARIRVYQLTSIIDSLSKDDGTAYSDLFALRSALERYGQSASGDIELDWDMYQDWPGGIAQEEELLLDYFRKLKFIYLEQETKLRFLADLQDDPETGQEPQILSAADVAQRGASALTRIRLQACQITAGRGQDACPQSARRDRRDCRCHVWSMGTAP